METRSIDICIISRKYYNCIKDVYLDLNHRGMAINLMASCQNYWWPRTAKWPCLEATCGPSALSIKVNWPDFARTDFLTSCSDMKYTDWGNVMFIRKSKHTLWCNRNMQSMCSDSIFVTLLSRNGVSMWKCTATTIQTFS